MSQQTVPTKVRQAENFRIIKNNEIVEKSKASEENEQHANVSGASTFTETSNIAQVIETKILEESASGSDNSKISGQYLKLPEAKIAKTTLSVNIFFIFLTYQTNILSLNYFI